MPRNGKIKVSLIVAAVAVGVVVVGGAWAYTLSTTERVAKVETRVETLEEVVQSMDGKIDRGFKAVLEALDAE